ncbi:hypothetical protein D3C76_1241240 [compost metagenome]
MRAVDQLGNTDDGNQRGVLQQHNQVVSQRRNSPAQRLRHDDVTLGLPTAEANGTGTFNLPRVYRHHAGTNDVGVVDGKVQTKTNDAGHQCGNIDTHLHKTIINHVQLQKQWRAHEQPRHKTHGQRQNLGRIKNDESKSYPGHQTQQAGTYKHHDRPPETGRKQLGIRCNYTKIQALHRNALTLPRSDYRDSQ